MNGVDFTMLGMTGSGKTCFLTGMYYEMSSGIQGYTLSADDDIDIELRNKWEKLCDEKIGINRFPVGTDKTERYRFTLEYAYEAIKDFNWLDYPGGDLEKKSTGNIDSYKEIEEAILKSTSLFICVDGALLCEKNKELMIENVRNKCSSKINGFLSRYQKNNNYLPPVAIVITKYDMCRDVKGEVMEEVIKRAFSSLFPENHDKNKLVTIIPVSIDMFDKLDDIVYEPVRVVCDYLREPIKAVDAHIETRKEQKSADIENAKKQLEADIEIQKANANIELEAKRRRLNAEIDDMIAESELKRNTAIVEAIKQYQIDLSQAVNECILQIGNMSMDLRERANNLVIEKTKEYTALQDKSKADAKKELKEIAEEFADNERVRIKMEDAVIDQMTNMITTANSFIKELSEDMKRLNANIDVLTTKGQDLVSGYLSPMTTKLMTENYTGIEKNNY